MSDSSLFLKVWQFFPLSIGCIFLELPNYLASFPGSPTLEHEHGNDSQRSTSKKNNLWSLHMWNICLYLLQLFWFWIHIVPPPSPPLLPSPFTTPPCSLLFSFLSFRHSSFPLFPPSSSFLSSSDTIQLGPWLAVEIPDLIEKGLVKHKENTETATEQ